LTANIIAELEGKNVYLADIGSPTLISLNDIRDDDGVHFTDAGYERVASIWTDVIHRMDEEGAISPATDTEYPDFFEGDGDPNCKKKEGHSYGPVDTQFGTRLMLKRVSVSGALSFLPLCETCADRFLLFAFRWSWGR
jgi:hypothetical protein